MKTLFYINKNRSTKKSENNLNLTLTKPLKGE